MDSVASQRMEEDAVTAAAAAPRVLLFRPDTFAPGGVANYFNVVQERFGEGVAVHTFTIGRRPGRFGHKLFYPVQFLLDFLRLVFLLMRRRFDIVHLNPSLNASAFTRDVIFAAIVSVLSPARLLIFFRGWDDDFFRRLNARELTRSVLRWLCLRADRVLVLGSSIRDDLVSIGVDKERIGLTHTTFDGALIQEAGQQAKSERFTFLFMSRFIKQKGIAELLEATRILKDRGYDFRLVLAGAGPFEVEARERIGALGLEAMVETPGYLRASRKGEVLVAADAFVFPTYHGEGCPNCLLEAMGASLPVITTRVGGIPDIVKSPDNGVILDSTEPSCIADAMQRLLDDPAYCARVGAQNQETAWSTYEAGAVASFLEELYATMSRRTG